MLGLQKPLDVETLSDSVFLFFQTYLGAVRFTTHVTKPYQTTQICVPSNPVFIGKYTQETTLAQAAVSFASVQKSFVVSV